MPGLIVLEDSAKNKALLDPNFRELLTMVACIRKETGIDFLDYDSFEVFSKALLSSMNTNVLKCIKHIFDSSGTPDEVLDAELRERRDSEWSMKSLTNQVGITQ